MARLPIPGGDNGNWGEILNDYLSQVLKSDGTIKNNAVTRDSIAPDAVTSTEIADGTVQEAQLASAVQMKLNQTAATWSTISGKPTVVAAGSDITSARSELDITTVPIKPGITNSELNAIFAEHDAVVVEAAQGDYTGLDGNITMKSEQKLIAVGAIFHSDTLSFKSYGMANATLPTATQMTALSADQTKGSFSIVLPVGEGPNYSIGDVVFIRADNQISYDPRLDEWGRPTELHHIIGVDNDTLKLAKALVHDYAVANNARIKKITINTGVSIIGATFKNVSTTPTARTPVVHFAQVIDPTVDVTSVDGGQVRIDDAIGGRIKASIQTSRPWDTLTVGPPYGYGVYLYGAGYGTEVDVTGWAARHLFTTLSGGGNQNTRTGPYSFVVRGSGFAGAQYGAHSVFDTHPHCYDGSFVGCVASAGDNDLSGSDYVNAAFAARGHRTTYLNCRGTGYVAGIRVDPGSSDTKIIGGHFSASGSAAATGALIFGTRAHIKGSVLEGAIAVTMDDRNNDSATGTIIENCYLKSTVKSIKDVSHGYSGDAAATAVNNIYELVSGIGFGYSGSGYSDRFVGRVDGIALSALSVGTLANLLTGLTSANGPLTLKGAGSPNGVLPGPIGSIYLQSDGSAGSTSFWYKESSASSTIWSNRATFGGNVSINGNLLVSGSLDLGNTSDTTLSRIAAGRVSIEGKEIAVNSGYQAPISYVAGNYYFFNSPQSGTTSAGLASDRVQTSAALITNPLTLSKLGIEFSAAGDPSSVYRIGIWNDDGYGRPGTLLLDAGTISTGSGNAGDVASGGTPGAYEVGANITLAPGLYHVGGAIQGVNTTKPTLRIVSINTVPHTGPSGAGSLSSLYSNPTSAGWIKDAVSGSLGDLTGTVTRNSSSSNAAPRIFFKVA